MNVLSNSSESIGLLHPGQMGVSIAAALIQAGHTVYWASVGRSSATVKRAQDAQLKDALTLEALCDQCATVFSVCPPDQAGAVARSVSATGFSGTYVDCNAVSPATSRELGAGFNSTANFIDAGIIGPPAKKSGTTRLYLSGKNADTIVSMFDGSVVEAKVVGSEPGAASALKMAYAGWTKGSAALLMTQYALAKAQNVDAALLDEWALSIPGLADELNQAANAMAPKAWRFVGEMHEIADTLEQAGLPRQWFDGAAGSYERLAGFKNQTQVDTQDVVNSLLTQDE